MSLEKVIALRYHRIPSLVVANLPSHPLGTFRLRSISPAANDLLNAVIGSSFQAIFVSFGQEVRCGALTSTCGRLRLAGKSGSTASAASTSCTVASIAISIPSGSNEDHDEAIAGIPYIPASLAAAIVPL